MKTDNELLPCPFCGGEGKINLNAQDNFYFHRMRSMLSIKSNNVQFRRRCKAHVIEKWNKRTHQYTQEDLKHAFDAGSDMKNYQTSWDIEWQYLTFEDYLKEKLLTENKS